MRVVTYNVNGIRPRLPRLLLLLDELRPDIVLLQETKTAPEQFPHLELAAAGYRSADHSGGRWEGVAVLARDGHELSSVSIGLPGEPNPSEARWVEATVDDVTAVSVYVPNGRALGTETFADKLTFLERMAERAGELAGEPTVIAGDVNVCPSDLDVWDAAQVHGATHVTDDERSRLEAVIDEGFTDAFRTAALDEPGFTWWDYRAGHFHKGFGLRIDLVLLSDPLAQGLQGAMVERSFRKPTKIRESKPSDHAPLVVDLERPSN